MKPKSSPQDQKHDQAIIELLKVLGASKVEYPPELLTSRRAAFVAQVEHKSKEGVKAGMPSRQEFLGHLEEVGAHQVPYPPELLAARRAAFIAQVEQLTPVREELTAKDQELIQSIKKIKSFDPEYAPKTFAARRAAFRRQIAWAGEISLLDALHSSIERLFNFRLQIPAIPALNVMRTSLVVASLLVAIFIGSLLSRSQPPLATSSPSAQGEVAMLTQPVATSTEKLAAVICQPGSQPPLCLAQEFDPSQDLTFAGNGSARPAVAKDTMPGYGELHKAAYANDGRYGPGTTWVSKSAYSWIKIDLGKPTPINTVTFGRDRLGNLNDGDPGQFVIAVALHDDVYADGVSTNDLVEYTPVFNSKDAGYDGVVAGSETIRAQFAAVTARYVKITFEKPGTAIDEVEVFMARPPAPGASPTRKPRDEVHILVAAPTRTPFPVSTATAIPTNTVAPTDTPVPPSNTPVPTDTSTPRPTRTPVPTDTSPPVPTDTMAPTATPVPVSTNTPVPPTNTAVPPTDVPVPVATDTAGPVVAPTETPLSSTGP
jgi:hypothetical protein